MDVANFDDDMVSDSLSITIDFHSQGIRFGLSAHGDELLAILLNDPIPGSISTVSFSMPCARSLLLLALGEKDMV